MKDSRDTRDLGVLSESTAETPLGRLPWVVQHPSDPAVLMASGESGGQEVQEACRKISPARLPEIWNDNQDTAVFQPSDFTAPSFITPSLYLLQKPNYPLSYMGEHDLIRVLMPGTSGLMARLRKITLEAKGQSLDGWGSMSPDHFQSF